MDDAAMERLVKAIGKLLTNEGRFDAPRLNLTDEPDGLVYENPDSNAMIFECEIRKIIQEALRG